MINHHSKIQQFRKNYLHQILAQTEMAIQAEGKQKLILVWFNLNNIQTL